jgi:hypothetical protein
MSICHYVVDCGVLWWNVRLCGGFVVDVVRICTVCGFVVDRKVICGKCGGIV